MLKDYFVVIKKYFYRYILQRNYFRIGKCNMCGRCCEKIYVKHGKQVLQDEEHFYKLRKMHRFYESLDLTGKDENGLIFVCRNLDKETRKCKVHSRRAKICRNYPQEEIFKMGGDMARSCGYKFVPIFSFESVMDKMKKSKNCAMFVNEEKEVFMKKGFTLAEVLITLAIIGVVAALTIPTVVQNYQKQQTVVQLKKAYTSLNQAMQMAVVNYGNMENWSDVFTADRRRDDAELRDIITKYFIPYMKVSKACAAGEMQQCWADGLFVYTIDGNSFNSNSLGAGKASFKLADGTTVMLITSYIGVNEYTINLFVDLNGYKAPNKLGKDIFTFLPDRKRNAMILMCEQCTRSSIINNSNGSGWYCKKGTGGLLAGGSCGALIQKDGWEIKDDYPWN